MRRNPIVWSLPLMAASFASAVGASEFHQHGLARMEWLLEKKTLVVRLMVPGSDAVGFEHEPQSPYEQERVDKTAALLSDPGTWLLLPQKAGCSLSEQATEFVPANEGEHHGHAHDHGQDEGSHHEIRATLTFTCQTPKLLTDIELKLFEKMPGLERIDYQAVGANQTQGSITPTEPRFPGF